MLLSNLKACKGEGEVIMVFGGNRDNLDYEMILDVFLLLILIWFLNREIELMTRIAYNGDLQATKVQKLVLLLERSISASHARGLLRITEIH